MINLDDFKELCHELKEGLLDEDNRKFFNEYMGQWPPPVPKTKGLFASPDREETGNGQNRRHDDRSGNRS